MANAQGMPGVLRGVRGLVASTLLVTTAAALAPVASRSAAATPPPGMSPVVQRGPNGVTADALPTVQINGVVWSQAVVGNTVYAGGNFTDARPAGAAPGTNLTRRANLLAYNLTTGALNTSFAPSLNGQVKTVAASPDGSRIYVGGAFTTANGQPRSRIAAYSTATGQLIAGFAPAVNAAVNAIVATNTVVYVGGAFTSANNAPRARLAAFSATNGALLSWAPHADNNGVEAMVLAPGGGKLVIGGSFTSINGSSAAYGLGAVDPSTGAVLPWAVSQTVKDAGTKAAILSLSTDGTQVYGSGWASGPGGNFEGSFAADPSGNLVWLEDCHGDTYSVFGVNGAVYTVSHAHFCGNVGGFPERVGTRIRKHAVAFTANATGTVFRNTQCCYPSFGGKPSPSVIDWFPDLAVGTFTGQSQAAWDVTGNSQYIVLGGEFPSVNGTPQQGLVRFGTPAVTTPRQGPMVSGGSFTPTLRPVSSSAVRVSWPANWDRDDQNLTYTVVRDGDTSHPIYTGTGTSQWWSRPIMGTVDSGLTPGSTHNYYVTAADPDGHKVRGNAATITVPTSSPSPYAQQILKDNASAYYRFDDPPGSTTARDAAGAVNLGEGSGVSQGGAGAIIGDSDTAANFNGTSSGTAWTPSEITAPNTFSLEAWFKTTVAGGKIIGFGNVQQGTSSPMDRHIYLNSHGQVTFGVYTGSNTVITSSRSYNDGAWHQVVATLSSAGMVLYVDGTQVAANSAVKNGRPVSGFWRIGGDSVNGWPSAPSNWYFTGSLDEVAVYPYALSPAIVQNHYALSGRTLPGAVPPNPTKVVRVLPTDRSSD